MIIFFFFVAICLYLKVYPLSKFLVWDNGDHILSIGQESADDPARGFPEGEMIHVLTDD